MIAASSLPETIASRYRPIRLIASGGMGTVYEVEHLVTGQRLALKVLWSNANASPEALARFKHEVRASARIRSDNVIRVTDADVAPELGNAPFLVMELLEGSDLERAARPSPPVPPVVLEWLRQVARAVDKAHRAGIVHRDLKPENLFLTTRGDGTPLVKILDFGLVKMIEEGTGATGTGQILGTPKYMAPEQASAKAPITPATDLCALGLIAFRLLTGESYYQGGIMVILGELLHGQLQPPSDRGSRLGAAFDAWFLKACHRNPEKRFASAAEQMEALAVALGLASLPFESSGDPAPAFWRRWIGGTRWRAALAGAAMMLVAVTAAFFVRHAMPPKRVAGSVCGLPSAEATAACGACMASACCKEAELCSATDGCAQIDGCVRACVSGDAACQTRCRAGRSAAASVEEALQACRASSCSDACLPPPWACLGHVTWNDGGPIPPKITIRTVAVCLNCGVGGEVIADGPGGSPLPGVRVRVCSVADPPCVHPLASGLTDIDGAVILPIDTLLYRPPLLLFVEYVKPGLADTLLFFNRPFTVDLDVGRVKLLDEKSNLEPTADKFGTTYDPRRAAADVYPTDCNGRLATKSVTLTWLDRDGATVTRDYFAYTQAAIALNLPVNAAAITRIVARDASTGQLIATVGAIIRPKANSEVHLAPAP